MTGEGIPRGPAVPISLCSRDAAGWGMPSPSAPPVQVLRRANEKPNEGRLYERTLCLHQARLLLPPSFYTLALGLLIFFKNMLSPILSPGVSNREAALARSAGWGLLLTGLEGDIQP